jgi:hypothetical protein
MQLCFEKGQSQYSIPFDDSVADLNPVRKLQMPNPYTIAAAKWLHRIMSSAIGEQR